MRPLATTPNLTERVYGAIVDEILDGRLEPGQHLVQEQLASQLGVSRQPVQQAMALLKSDGLVEETGRRGLTVAQIDLARMRHHYQIRAVLDGYGARAAAAAVASGTLPPETVAERMCPVLEMGTAAARDGSVRDQISHDEAFHKLIYDLSGNPVLAETAEPNWRFLRRAMAGVLRYATSPAHIWNQHRVIFDAIVAGDPERAGDLAQSHVDAAAAELTAALSAPSNEEVA